MYRRVVLKEPFSHTTDFKNRVSTHSKRSGHGERNRVFKSNLSGTGAKEGRYLSDWDTKLFKCVSYNIGLMDRDTALRTLNLKGNFTADELKRSYRNACLRHHPDKQHGKEPTDATVSFTEVREAYVFLQKEDSATKAAEFIDRDLINFLFWFALNVCRPTLNKETPKETSERKSTELIVDVSLEEVYNAAIKKLVYRRKLRDRTVTETLFLELINFREEYLIPKKGDNEGELLIKINLVKSGSYYLDDIMSSHDLYLKKRISVFEYYYGLESSIDLPNGETIQSGETRPVPSVASFPGYGLPYEDENGAPQRGTFYVLYDVDMSAHSLREEHRSIVQELFSQNIDE